MSKAICQVCGRELGFITPPHLRSHGLTTKEYLNLFPGAKVSSEERGVKISEAQKGKEGYPLSPETRAKISEASKGKPKHEGFGAKLSKATKGKPKPSLRAYYQSELGLLKREKLSFFKKGGAFWIVPGWRLLWRRFVWPLKMLLRRWVSA